MDCLSCEDLDDFNGNFSSGIECVMESVGCLTGGWHPGLGSSAFLPLQRCAPVSEVALYIMQPELEFNHAVSMMVDSARLQLNELSQTASPQLYGGAIGEAAAAVTKTVSSCRS